MSSFDVADAYCWVLQTLNFNVTDVEFRCSRHMMSVFVLRREGAKAPGVMLHATRVATWSQHGRNMEEGGGLLMFDCCTQPSRNGSQHLLPGFESDG
jgi:hypothetical protein